MSDTAITAPVAPVSAPVSEAPKTPQFTSKPIEVKQSEPVGAEPTSTEPKTDPKPDNVIAALAKASAAERQTKKQLAERDERIKALETELETAKAGGSKAQEIQAELDAILKNPGILLKKGKSFQEILDALAEPDAQPDPKYTELEQRLAAQEKADKERQEAAEKAAKEAEERTAAAANESARKFIANVVATEGVKPGQDGIARWALVSADDTAVERARIEVLNYVTENKIEQTEENVTNLLCQAFDQMEQVARDEVTKRYERLRPTQPVTTERRINEPSFVRASTEKTAVAQPRQTTTQGATGAVEPGISTAVRGNPLPPPSVPKGATFTGGLR